MKLSTNQNRNILIISVDGDKAFDRLNWKLRITTLQKAGFGESFINQNKAQYTSQMNQVNSKGLISESFTVHSMTRQGCPLPPTLFAVFCIFAKSLNRLCG